MTRAAPGGFLWLVLADLRLARRRLDLLGRARRQPSSFAVVAFAVVGFHAFAWLAAIWLRDAGADPARRAVFLASLASAMLFVLPWLTSQALTNATRSLYARGDLDLLLASPTPGSRVLGARAFAICLEAVGAVALFIAPVANMAALVDGPRWLALYPTLLGAGLLATALGLCVAMALFALIGPRRTRLVAQALAMLIGGGFVVGLQALNFAPEGLRAAILAGIERPTPGGPLDPAGPWWLPVRAALGEPAALVGWLALGAGAFALACLLLGARFRHATAQAASASSEAPMRAPSPMRAFRAGAGAAIRRKEWLSLLRDPWAMSQIGMQALYTLPIAFVLWRSQGPEGSAALALGPTLVVVASQFAASLTWLATSSEDAPDFIATAPVAARVLTRHKMEAVVAPLLLALGPAVLLLALHAPADGAIVGLVVVLAGASTALVNLWNPAPASRATLMRRHAQSKIVGVVEHSLSLLWALCVAIAIMGSAWAIAPAIIALITVASFRKRPATA